MTIVATKGELRLEKQIGRFEIIATAKQVDDHSWVSSATVVTRFADGSVESQEEVPIPATLLAPTDIAAASAAMDTALRLIYSRPR